MLSPKRTKFRKQHKGRIHGLSKGGTALNFGTYGLMALMLSGFLSVAAVYLLNRYLGPIDDLPQTTGSIRHLPLN